MGCTLAMPRGFADKRRDLGAQCASHPSRTHTLTHLRPKHLVSAPSFSWSSWREALSWVLQKTWHAFQYFSHVPSWTPPVRTVNGSRQIGPRTVGPRTVGPRTIGPRTTGPRCPICHFFKVDSWAPDNWAPGPNCPGPNLPLFQGGQLGPGQLGPRARLSVAQFATFSGRTVGPRTVGPRSHYEF